MKFLKYFLILVLLIGAVLAAGGYYLYENRDRMAKEFIEMSLSKNLGVPVTLKALNISLEDRKATLNSFIIANPDGFKNINAVSFDDITVKLGDISQDLIVIKDISISGAQVYYTAQSGGSNFTKIKENMDVQKSKPKEPSFLDNIELPVPKLIVDRFALEKATIYPEMKIALGQGLDTTVTLSDLEMTDIGRGENGVKLKVAADAILSRLMSRVRNAVARAGFFEGLSQAALMGVTGGIPVLGIGDEVMDVGEGVLKTIRGVGSAILGGDDDEDDSANETQAPPPAQAE